MTLTDWARRIGGALAFALLAAPAAAGDRPLTIRDAVSMSSFGGGTIDPKGRWVVYERFGPYDAAPAYDRLFRSTWALSEVWIAAVDGDRPPERLLPVQDGPGVLLGAWSPNGERLLVYRLRGERLEAGVATLRDRSVWWTGLAADWGVTGAAAAWIDEDRLGLTILPDGQGPYLLRQPGDVQRTLPERWAAQRAGHIPSRTVFDTAGGVATSDQAEPRTAVTIVDVRQRTASLQITGRIRDWAASPDGRTLAVLTAGEGLPFEPGRIAQLAPLERGRLALIDLASGRRASLDGDWDVAGHLLRWSAGSRALLLWVRREGQAWSDGALARVTPDGALAVVPTGALAPLRPGGDIDALSGVRADWLGDTPVLYARRSDGVRFDWWALEAGGTPRALTAQLDAPPPRVSAVSGDRMLMFADGALWRIGGRLPKRLSAPGVAVSDAARPDRMSPVRLRINTPPRRDWVLALDNCGRISRRNAAGRVSDLGPTDPSVESRVLGADGTAAVLVARDQGVESLSLAWNGSARRLDQVNADFAGMALARPVAIRHRNRAGGEATSWLFLPPGPPAPVKGVVVLAYPGAIEDGRGVTLEQLVFGPRPSMLAAEGYAVLSPDIPVSARGGGAIPEFEAGIDLAVDAMAAAYPDLPLDRMALMGHSFGGYVTLAIAERSSRYRTYIAWAGVSDLFGQWGEFTPQTRVTPQNGFALRQQMGWVESGQAEISGPPWAKADRYLAESPFMAADRIRAPVLLIAADQDFVPLSQSERMFSALNRSGGRARLVTYWGEWHNNTSPANIVDVYDQITRWLEETLNDPPRGGVRGDRSSVEPRPRSPPRS